MTTIVFDGKYLAADKRGTLGFDVDARKRHCTECGVMLHRTHTVMNKPRIPEQKTLFENEVVIAMGGAGSSAMCDYMAYIVETHPSPDEALRKLPKTARQVTAQLLILTEQNVYTIEASGRLIKHLDLPVIIGSGKQAATFAVKHGSHAMEAIQMASQVGDGTGLEVDYIEIVPSDKFTIQRYKG